MASSTAPSAPMSSDACAGAVPTLHDSSGLSGQVCGINIISEIRNISPCCDTGAEIRYQDDCMQFCRWSGDIEMFEECLVGLMLDGSTPFHLNCEDVNEGIGGPVASQTAVMTDAPIATLMPTGNATGINGTKTTSDYEAATPGGMPPPAPSEGGADYNKKRSVTVGVITTLAALGFAFALF